jgi:hypothetical protein
LLNKGLCLRAFETTSFQVVALYAVSPVDTPPPDLPCGEKIAHHRLWHFLSGAALIEAWVERYAEHGVNFTLSYHLTASLSAL